MITQYHRPKTIEEAIRLLSKPGSRPLGGGTNLNQSPGKSFSVVDLQLLKLDTIQKVGDNLNIGATATLQSVLENQHIPPEFRKAIQHDIPLNLRNMATIGGSIVSFGGRSPFLTALLAFDPVIFMSPDDDRIHLGDLLPLREEILAGKIITHVTCSLKINLQFEFVARTPMDKPIICVAMGKWESGRTRVVLGGWGQFPTLAMDGKLSATEANEALEMATRNATIHSSDEWASEDYRQQIAGVLAKRCWARSIR